MSTSQDEKSPNRRDFLKIGAVAAPAAVATAVTGEAANAETQDDRSEGLRKTPHVEAYLASARF